VTAFYAVLLEALYALLRLEVLTQLEGVNLTHDFLSGFLGQIDEVVGIAEQGNFCFFVILITAFTKYY
jgi:hypothetical protein